MMLSPVRANRKKLLWQTIVAPVLGEKSIIVTLAFSLFLIAASQGALILLLGPLLKGLFLLQSEESLISINGVFPPMLINYFPSMRDLQIEKSTLAIAIPLSVLTAGALRNLAMYLYNTSVFYLALTQAKTFRDRLFAAILSFDYRKILSRSPGQWMSLIMNDVLLMQVRFSDILNAVLRDLVVVIAAFIAMLIIHWPTALVLAMIAPALAWHLGGLGRKIANNTSSYQKELGLMSHLILELRDRFAFVKAARGEDYELRRFNVLNNRYYQSARASVLHRALLAPFLELSGFLVFAAAVYYYAGTGKEGLGMKWLLFWATLAMLLKPLRNLGEQLAKFHESMGSIEDSLTILANTKSGSSMPQKKRFVKLNQDVVIKHLSVSYDGKHEVLQLSNLKFKQGKAHALIGASGAGKSALVKTLSGLLKPLKWEANISWEELKSSISYVSQEPYLFTDSILRNLTYAQDHPQSAASVIPYLEAVGLDQDIKKLEQGLDYRLESMGSKLSGGQIQRLTLARALLSEGDFFVCDEVTSAVDPKTELQIIKALIELCHKQGATLLFSSHRMESLALFDEVIFINNTSNKPELTLPQTLFTGPHAELLKDPQYRFFTEGR